MKDEYQSYSFCSPAQFKCQNSNMCIDRDLLCDRVDNCGDYSDELPDSYSQCKDLGKFSSPSLGTAFSLHCTH